MLSSYPLVAALADLHRRHVHVETLQQLPQYLALGLDKPLMERPLHAIEVFYSEPVEEKVDLKQRRCSDQPVLVSYGEVQESHLIGA